MCALKRSARFPSAAEALSSLPAPVDELAGRPPQTLETAPAPESPAIGKWLAAAAVLGAVAWFGAPMLVEPASVPSLTPPPPPRVVPVAAPVVTSSTAVGKDARADPAEVPRALPFSFDSAAAYEIRDAAGRPQVRVTATRVDVGRPDEGAVPISVRMTFEELRLDKSIGRWGRHVSVRPANSHGLVVPEQRPPALWFGGGVKEFLLRFDANESRRRIAFNINVGLETTVLIIDLDARTLDLRKLAY